MFPVIRYGKVIVGSWQEGARQEEESPSDKSMDGEKANEVEINSNVH